MKRKGVSLNAKILLIVFINVYVVCWFFSWRVLGSSMGKVLKRSYDSTINEQVMFGNYIKTYCEVYKSFTSDSLQTFKNTENINKAILLYKKSNKMNASDYRITDEYGTEISSNISNDRKNDFTLTPPIDGTIQYQLHRTSHNSYIYVSSYVLIDESLYKIDYIKDITELLNEQVGLSYEAFYLLAIVSFLLLISVYFSIRATLRPLHELEHQARTITNGQYSLRVKTKSHNEVGRLAEGFNQMAEAIEERIHVLNDTVKRRELYAANLAHEIKTPITSIIGYTDIAMLLELERDKMYEILNYINKEGKRIDALSSALMEWSQLSSGYRINVLSLKTERLCRHIKMMLKPILDDRKQTLDIENDVPVIRADETLIVTLLRNLLMNASNASGEGQRIELHIKASDNGFAIVVKDSGMGMEESELDKITEPFYMIDKARSRKNHGAGLGLALCDTIVKEHNGSMQFISHPESGTTVTVEIPELQLV